MNDKSDFDKTLVLTKLALQLSGIKIDEVKSTTISYILDYLFYFNFIWINTVVVAEFYWFVESIQLGKDFEEVTFIAPCVTITLLATVKSVPIFINKNNVNETLKKLREIHPSVDDNNAVSVRKEMKITRDSIKYLDLIIKFLFSIACMVITAFNCLPIVTMIIDYYTKGSFEMKYPLLCKYFFDTYTGFRSAVVYLHQFISILQVSLNILGPDTLLYAFSTFIQMHFRILKIQLEDLISEEHDIARDKDHVKMKFAQLVTRHQELIDIVARVERLYAMSTLFNFITSSFLICLSGFNVTTIKKPDAVIAFTTFLFMNISQIFMLCYCGDMIMRTSTDVGEGAYNCRWYLADVKLRRCMHILILRSKKPCKITAANFADLNLSAFTTVLSRSWSYFALLKTVYN